MAKLLPETINSSHYRFPAQGQSYIKVPHEAFRSQGECSCRGRPRTSGAMHMCGQLRPCRHTVLTPARLFLQERLWASISWGLARGVLVST